MECFKVLSAHVLLYYHIVCVYKVRSKTSVCKKSYVLNDGHIVILVYFEGYRVISYCFRKCHGPVPRSYPELRCHLKDILPQNQIF